MRILLALATFFLALPASLHAKGDLDANGVTVNDTSPDPGDTVTVRWTALNRTGDYIGSSNQGVMFSSDSTISRGDTLLEKEPLGPLGGLLPDSSPETRVVRIPSWAVRGRTYWIGIYADYDRRRSEDKENNNNSAGVAITIRHKDLYATNLSINDSTPDLGDWVTVSWTARTRSDTPVPASQQGIVLSTDNTINSSDQLLEKEYLGALGGALAASTPELRTITIPENLDPGTTYYLGVIMDYDGDVSESIESNNNNLAGSFTPRGPDLEARDLEAYTSIFVTPSTTIATWPGDTLFLDWTAANSGDGATALLDFSKQAIRWSEDPTVNRSDRILEKEDLGILTAGDTSPELRAIEIPDDVKIGETYYLAIEADTDREFREHDETNNFSNVIEVTIVSPLSSFAVNVSDYNELPYLEGEGFEGDDPRMRDKDGDGDEDAGATMNPSRCFGPTDAAYINLEATLSIPYTSDFNPVADIRLTAWWNTSPTLTGATNIGNMVLPTSLLGETLNLQWNPPNAEGEYYVYVKGEVKVEGVWYQFHGGWIDDGDPIYVSHDPPVVLVHGWSDDKGHTFGDLEYLIETLWQRPVRAFGYETDNTYDTVTGTGTGDGPRVDLPYTEIGPSAETKPSLAQQMKEFLASPEGDGTTISDCDVIAHSMGGLVARNYILRERGKVRRLVTLGTPSYGGLFANLVPGLLNNQAEDLEFGAPVTWKLHREWGDPANRPNLPQTLTVVGTNDLGDGQFNQSDLVVPCNSASLEGLGYPVYYVPLGHSPTLSAGTGAVAFIEDEQHPSWPAIEAFLNTESGELPPSLPGHNGGANDVGDKDHSDPLTNGALYIVKLNASGNPESITSVNLGHTPSWLPIESSGIHADGIYFANLVGASASSTGQRSYTDADSDVLVGGQSFNNLPIRVYAGQTTVHIVGGRLGDLDGDSLPDSIEQEIIGASPIDSIFNLSHVGPEDDFDGDRLNELLEAALGTNPLVAEFDALETEARDGFLYLRHRESTADLKLEIIGQRSNNLVDWTEQGLTESILETNPTFRIKEWSIPIDSDQGYLRLEVRERPPSP